MVQDDLLTTGQLGQELGLSRQWVDKIIRDAEGGVEKDRFPTPEVVLPNKARLWKKDIALQWFKEHPRRPYGRKSASEESDDPAQATRTAPRKLHGSSS
jgi:predicted DNA-binding transcriptional regulator AlpA